MIKNTTYYSILIVAILLASCTSSPSTKEDDDNGQKTVQKVSEKYLLLNEQLENMPGSSDYFDSINLLFYQHETIKSIWFTSDAELNNDAIELLKIARSANHYGLNPSKYKNLYDSTESKLLTKELALNKTYILLANDLHFGITNKMKNHTKLELKQKDTIHFGSLINSNNVIDNLLALQPIHHEYHKLQKALSLYVSNNTLSDSLIYIPNFHKDSILAYSSAKKVLVRLDILSKTDTGSLVIEGVKKFQRINGLHADGLIGKNTVRMLEFTSQQIYDQAAINLEKWKWIAPWGDSYLYANIPEYFLHIYENDSLRRVHKTVVGTVVNKTPEIDSKLEYFIVNPEWYVPFSITTKELIPKMKKDSTYLARNGYAISSGGSIKDIDWANATAANANFKIKQTSGGHNALGKVKFIFKNDYSVYLHDTPSKSFFNKGIRSYSHGCVRLQHPLELAEYIIEKEQKEDWVGLMDSMLTIKKTKTFTPSNEYPIHIGYFTSVGDSNNYLKTMIDVYQKDTALIKEFKMAYNITN